MFWLNWTNSSENNYDLVKEVRYCCIGLNDVCESAQIFGLMIMFFSI